MAEKRSRYHDGDVPSEWDRCREGFTDLEVPAVPVKKQTFNASYTWPSSSPSSGDEDNLLPVESPEEENDEACAAADIVWEDNSCPADVEGASCVDRNPSSTQSDDITANQSQYSAEDNLFEDYENISEDDSPEVEKSLGANSQDVTSPSPIISTGSSIASTLSDLKRKKPDIKASNWAKCIQQQMDIPVTIPKRSSTALEDSAKKIKKFKKCGLVEHLVRLSARERSAKQIWNHQQSDGNYDNSKTLTVRVLSSCLQYSLYVSLCAVMLPEEGPQDSISRHRQKVLFSNISNNPDGILQGAIIKIYPPWQELQMPDELDFVILCTHYTRVSSPEGPAKAVSHWAQNPLQVAAQWKPS